VAEVRFSEHDQQVMRALMTAEPVPGRPLPHPDVLASILELVPCDSVGAVYADLHGRITSHIGLIPHGARQTTLDTAVPLQRARSEHSGPFYLGYTHWREHPAQADNCGNLSSAGDGLAVGYRNGCDAGCSNAQIADTLCISVGTVRKHLEHAYRKLGVTNRMAAPARLQGGDEAALDMRERLDRYA
jgi:regulatory LuxR family protein